jgi:peptidoglycan-associated lipoprotein
MKKISKKIKRNILISLLIFLSLQVMSQEKGSYLSLSGGVGPSGFNYKINNDINSDMTKRDILLGGQAGIGYSYYFTKHIGISIGVGFSHYKTQTTLKGDFQPDKYFNLGTYKDNDPFNNHIRDYELRVRTQNWTEFQSGKFVEIPLMLNLQKKFGEKESFGLYFSTGVKFQIPFAAKYAVIDGDNNTQQKLMVSGYYPEDNLELGGFGGKPLPQHGFDNIHNPGKVLNNAKGNLNLNFNISAVAEAGILISLSRRVDLTLGAFIDYGLWNINRKGDFKAMFTGPENDYVSGAGYNVADGITYNSILKSTYGNERYVNNVKSISYGGKAGIRIKLGKLSQKQEPQTTFAPCGKDTVYIYKTNCDSMFKEVMNAIKEIPGDTSKSEIIREIIKEVSKETPKPNEDENEFPAYIPQEEIDFLFAPIYFDFDKSTLKPESIKDLDKKVEILKKYPEMKLVIYGNTCDLGNDPYNIKLGQKRAETARNYLIGKGIPPERLESGTLSKYQPEKPNTDESNRTHNRRDDFRPVYQKK